MNRIELVNGLEDHKMEFIIRIDDGLIKMFR